MKKFLLPLLLIIAACGDTKPGKNYNKQDTVSMIKEQDTAVKQKTLVNPISFIRQQVEYINTTNLKHKHIEFMCDEKTKVDYFYEGDAPVKIAVDYGWVGDVHAKEDYYFNQGQLIFFYELTEGGPACEGCIKTNEYRSYIEGNKVIKYLKNKDETKCKRCEFGTASKPYKLLMTSSAEEAKKALCN